MFGLALILSAVRSLAVEPPFYEISASSLYDAGLQQGRLASSRIHTWMAAPEMRSVVAFVQGKGSEAFAELKRKNGEEFPELAEEVRGIAQGADLDLDSVWAASLLPELEALMNVVDTDHCSDIYAVSEGGFADGFTHGHNEDWQGIVNKLFYFVKITATSGANFSSCAGLAYPGALIGWAPTWNEHGLYLTQNSLFPRGVRSNGLAGTFVQRDAICGPRGRMGIDEIVDSITSKPWSYGASINLIDMHARRFANIEVSEDKHVVYEVTEATGNYSHFNMYKNLPGVAPAELSSAHRQARADALPAPRDQRAVIAILSDDEDHEYPIYNNSTLATLVLDGLTGVLDIWAGSAAASGVPVYSWNLFEFFEESPTVLQV